MSKDIENNQLTKEEEKQIFENLKNISWTLNNADQDKGDEKLCIVLFVLSYASLSFGLVKFT